MIYPDPNYFDYCASAPPYEIALERFKEISLKFYANPSSSHNRGRDARLSLLKLKEDFCELLNYKDGRLLMCSSGTEANNTIIEGHVKRTGKGRILLAENVHDSMWYATEKHKSRTDIVKIDQNGMIDPEHLRRAIRTETSLVCINHVCNETGAIQDIEILSGICSNRNIRLLIDGVQAVGHIPLDMEHIQCDYYTFSAHKFGGPRSVGGLLIRDDGFDPLFYGGKQEWGLRAGTENPGGLAGTVAALEQSLEIMNQEARRLGALKNLLIDRLLVEFPALSVNSPDNCLPGFISLSFAGFQGSEIVKALAVEGFSISTGSACHDNQVEPSRIIMALGRSAHEAKGTIRISMGRGNTEKSVQGISGALINFIRT
jgi:cysteine desulfurase